MKCCLNQCCSSNWLSGPRDFPANSLCDCWLSPPLPTPHAPTPHSRAPPHPALPCRLLAQMHDASSSHISRRPLFSKHTHTHAVEMECVYLGNTVTLGKITQNTATRDFYFLILVSFGILKHSKKCVTVEQRPVPTHRCLPLPSSPGNYLTPGLGWK